MGEKKEEMAVLIPQKTGRVTLADVGREAGVSAAAVSYVLGGKAGGCRISDATAECILAAADRLGYRKNEAAAALARRRAEKLSLFVFSPWLYAQYSDFTYRVNCVLGVSGADVRYINYTAGNLKAALTRTAVRGANAVFVMGTAEEDERWLCRNRENFPCVIAVNRKISGVLSVYGNDGEATEALCRRVRASGAYRRAAIFHSACPSSCERERIRAFFAVFPEGEDVSSAGSPERVLRDKIGKDERVFLFSPQSEPACRLVTIAVREGYDVPGKLGVAGYDVHSLLKDYLPLPITAVDPGTEEMVRAALGLAFAVRRGETPASACVPAVPIIGKSVVL